MARAKCGRAPHQPDRAEGGIIIMPLSNLLRLAQYSDNQSVGRAGRVFRKKILLKTLHIKDPEAHRLATAIAQETGETMTRVVTEAPGNALIWRVFMSNFFL